MSGTVAKSWSFVNATIEDRMTTVRICDERIDSVGAAPCAGERTIDLCGDRLLPGLINAHDHLQWNSLSRPPRQTPYANVSEWILETARASGLAADHDARVSRGQRLLRGGLKNLLCGVTTVAHHDPLYVELTAPTFPVRVVERYGWSHSLGVHGAQAVAKSYWNTPADCPWIVHAAEGVDESAAREFAELEALGCVGSNTLLVHALALDASDFDRLHAAGAGVIWCPSSNLYLFGKSIAVEHLVSGSVVLGTDSRLSGTRDLLAELRVARETSGLADGVLESMVTRSAARRLRLRDRGVIRPGALADFTVFPAGKMLADLTRADVRLVVIGGVARFGDAHYAVQFQDDVLWTRAAVDGAAKLLQASIADLYLESSDHEPGLEIERSSWRAA